MIQGQKYELKKDPQHTGIFLHRNPKTGYVYMRRDDGSQFWTTDDDWRIKE